MTSLLVAVLDVPAADAELAADRMWMAGAQAVEERELGERSEVLSVLGDDADLIATRLGPLTDGWILRVDEVDPTPSETWRQFVAPITVEPDVVLRPAWVNPEAAPSSGESAIGASLIEVVIEPAGSFGLGDHPTTRLCAAAVRRLVSGGEAVLDVGCGSGVLSILALLCGAATATATDISDVAVAATLDNAARNGVADRLCASTQSLADVEHPDEHPAGRSDDSDGRFDLVVANILAPTLRSMSDDLRQRLAPRGHLVLSGVLEGGADSVIAAFTPLVACAVDRLDGWVAITMRHPESGTAS